MSLYSVKILQQMTLLDLMEWKRDLIVVVVLPRPLPSQDEDIEGGEGRGVESERLRVVVDS